MKPWLALLIPLLTVALSIGAMEPPSAAPVTASPGEFSAERAMAHVRDLARAPHPPGTPEHARVRDELLKRFSALGLSARVQKTRVVNRGWEDTVVVVDAENIVARLKGRESGPALMLTAHYDSHASGPGAGDDMSGVATLLETARALSTSSQPLRRDVLFVVTDAEEQGLLGAHGFVDSAPEAKESPFVVNFEARGGGGPVFMFETGDGNHAAIEALSRAPHPLATSLMYALYKTLPNDTDLTVFKDAGKGGLNFAFADRYSHYHTFLDTPDGLDARSVQQEGDNALSLARTLTELGSETVAPEARTGDAIYFDLFRRTLVRYPQTWAWPTVGFTFLAWLAALVLARKEPVFWKSSLAGVGVGALAMIHGGAIATVFGYAIGPLREGAPWRDPYGARWLEAALALLALASVLPPIVGALRRWAVRPLALGGLFWWVALALLTAWKLPGATYLFVWPLFFASISLISPKTAPWLSVLAGIPTVVLLTPVWHGLALLLGFGMPPLLGILVGLGAIPLIPSLYGLHPRAWLVPLGAGAACALVGWLAFPFGPANPKASVEAKPQLSKDAPKVERLSLAGLRISPSNTECFEIAVESSGPVSSATLDGEELPLVNGKLALRFCGPPKEGFTLKIDAPQNAKLQLDERVLDTSPGAPGRLADGSVRWRRTVTVPQPPPGGGESAARDKRSASGDG